MPTLTFPNADGVDLAAQIDLPAEGTPRAWALFAHCFTCTKDLRGATEIARSLTAAGFGVLRFDFTGLGESEGEFAETTFSSNVADLVAAAEFLGREYQAPSLLVGHSLGGAAVLMATPLIESVDAVATVGAPFDPAHVRHLLEDGLDEIAYVGEATVRIGGRPFRVKQQFVDDLQALDARSYLASLDTALLVLHAPGDTTVSVDNARLIFDSAHHPKSFVSLDTADHLLTKPDDARYAGQVIAGWASRYVDLTEAEPAPAGHDHVVTHTRQGFRTEVTAGRHTWVADEPVSVGGEDLGATPYQLLAAALGTCTGMTLRMYADHKKWPLDGVRVTVQHEKKHAADCHDCTEKDVKLDHLTRTIAVEGDLDAKQRARLIEIANKCPVHRTLESEIVIVTEAEG